MRTKADGLENLLQKGRMFCAKTKVLQSRLLYTGTFDPGNVTDSEYKSGIGSIADHIGILQYFHNFSAELWRYDAGAVFCFCSG